jgi:cytochrome c-type biogenesis protein CcmH/NrfG
MKLGGATAAHYDQLGRIRFQQGRYEEASRNFRESIRMAPGASAALYLLGHSEFRQSHYREAAGSFQAYLVSHPASAEARRFAAVSLARSGRIPDALAILGDSKGWLGSEASEPASLADSLRKGEFPQ